MQPLTKDLKDAIDYFINYINKIVIPSKKEFDSLLKNNEIQLYQAYSFSAIYAHAIDYMVFIDKEVNKTSRGKFINKFDKFYSIEGSIHISNKFKLLDAVNNSFKHVELNPERDSNKEVLRIYGKMTFDCLQENNGKIFFITEKYKFDYCRIVLKPIINVFNITFRDVNDVINFINGKRYGVMFYKESVNYDPEYNEPYNAIDRMIEYCDPRCLDCDEFQNECDCKEFLYDGKKSKSNLHIDENFDFNETMSQISGSREWSRT